MIPKLKKTDPLPMHLGALKPVGHVVVAFADDITAERAEKALLDDGVAADEVLRYTAVEMAALLRPLVGAASGAAGFGSEIEAMRNFLELAEEGSGWLFVYAPETDAQDRVTAIAKQHDAEVARKYNRLLIEELL